MNDLKEQLENTFDGTTVEIMNLLSNISESDILIEFHYTKKDQTVSIKAIDNAGYRYKFERIGITEVTNGSIDKEKRIS